MPTVSPVLNLSFLNFLTVFSCFPFASIRTTWDSSNIGLLLNPVAPIAAISELPMIPQHLCHDTGTADIRRVSPRLPNVLAAVVITTILSWGLGFERNVEVDIAALHSELVQQAVTTINHTFRSIVQMTAKRAELIQELNLNRKVLDSHAKLDIRHAVERLALRIEQCKGDAADYRSQMRSYLFKRVRENQACLLFYQVNKIAALV